MLTNHVANEFARIWANLDPSCCFFLNADISCRLLVFCLAGIRAGRKRAPPTLPGEEPTDSTNRTDKTSSETRQAPRRIAARRRAGKLSWDLAATHPPDRGSGPKPCVRWPTRAPVATKLSCPDGAARPYRGIGQHPVPMLATATRHRPTRMYARAHDSHQHPIDVQHHLVWSPIWFQPHPV